MDSDSKDNVVVVGSSGQAKVVIDIIEEMGIYNITGITSKEPNADPVFGYPIIGDDDSLTEYRKKCDFKLAMAVGGYRDNNRRKHVFNNLKSHGFDFINVIHPFSFISKRSTLGEGIVVYAGTVVNTGATVGNNCVLALNSSVGHDTIIEDHVLISAGANVGADSVIGESSLIAIGVKIVSGVKIGKNALVAGGSVVTKDIENDETVFGIPARSRNDKK